MSKETEEGKDIDYGICPLCNSIGIDYGACYPEGEMMCYPFTCNGCRKTGKEWYRLEYVETIMDED